MYVCQCCLTTVPPRTPAHRISIETRLHRYPTRPRANRILRKGKERFIPDPGGDGCEIAREIVIRPACLRRIVTDQTDGDA
jgi:hypothetical protein